MQVNADKVLFAASAIKTFALCEALRQVDSPDIDNALAVAHGTGKGAASPAVRS